MRRSRIFETMGFIVAAIAVVGTAQAGTRIYVTLAGRDDSIPKYWRPGIAVRIDAPSSYDASVLGGELAREFARQVHTRRLEAGEVGDYDLEVKLDATRIDGSEATIPFEAILKSGRGESLWRIDGRAEVEGAPLDDAVVTGIGRNVVSALIHDGWVQPRYDPDDPPPQPPVVRLP